MADEKAKTDVSNPQKKFFPSGIKKIELVEYYRKISDYMVPYLNLAVT